MLCHYGHAMPMREPLMGEIDDTTRNSAHTSTQLPAIVISVGDSARGAFVDLQIGGHS